MSEDNKALLQRFCEMFNTGNLTLAEQILTSDIQVRYSGEVAAKSLQEFKQLVIGLSHAFPNRTHKIEHVIAEGDLVAVDWSLRGRHEGEYRGIAPTGKEVVILSTVFYRIVGGRIGEIWGNIDRLGVLQQLGALPQ